MHLKITSQVETLKIKVKTDFRNFWSKE